VPAVFLHGVEDGFGLEADGFESGTGDVAALGVVCYTNCLLSELGESKTHEWQLTHRAVGIIDPIWRKKSAKSCYEYETTVVLDGLGKLADLVRLLFKAKVICHTY